MDAASRTLPPGLDDGAGRFTGLFLRRPVLALVINLLIVVAGLAALIGVEIRELPDIDRPVVTVTTAYPGASAETVDTEITDRIEAAATRVPGVASLSSSSRFGRSRVVVEFADTVDLAAAANDLRDSVARIRNDLPEEAEDPVIVKADADADPVMRLAVTADSVPIQELTRIARDEVAERLSGIAGVADVQLRGDRGEVLYVDVDPAALAARGLDVADVARLIAGVTGEIPAGRLRSRDAELAVRTDSTLREAEEFAALSLDERTRLEDVSRVFYAADLSGYTSRANALPAVGLNIIAQAGSNTLEISRAVRAEVARIVPLLPPGVSIRIGSDDAIFVRGAIGEVVGAIFIATLIVIGVILIFLRSLRAVLIPAVTMPVALLGTFGGIYLAGFSVNILTLLALVLATGMVVDDAIVVLENVSRRRAMGLGPRAAALVGVREVFFAVIATTATLAAVFVPISFLPGQAGGLFREFGFVLAIAVAISSVVTLTLCPVMAARILPAQPGAGVRQGPAARFAAGIGRMLGGLYAALLRAALGAPVVTVILALLVAAAAWPGWRGLPRAITPPEDRALLLVSVSTAPGVSHAYTDAQMRRIESILGGFRDRGEAEMIYTFSGYAGANRGFVVVRLAPWQARDRDQAAIAGELAGRLARLPGVRAFPIQPNSLHIRGGGRGLQIAVAGQDYARLTEAAGALIARMQQDARFGDVRLTVDQNLPQLTVRIDRARAADLGIDVTGLARAVQSVLDGRELGTVHRGGSSAPIRLIATATPIDDPSDLENILLRTDGGRIVPMSAIATLREAAAPASLDREEGLRAVRIAAGLTPGFALQAALAEAERLAGEVLPQGTRLLPLAEAAALGDTAQGLMLTFAMALIVVVLVLAAQFESFLAALIIILTVPLGVACAVFAIALTGGSLNVYSQIGLVLLVGVMAKNGILIVEFANQLRERGLGLREAIEAASLIRLRPVVMTAVSTVLGGLPLVLSSGAGAEAREALGWVVVGGLGLATLATLFLTPVTYLALARFTRLRRVEAERLAEELRAAEARLAAN
ncbi:MAG: efflux RND transporter permease subunit [Alphaproteobacteria bacterium]|nr:MAG: efflux RND transporter permease subunit [Alphaproteobacteria bacterium]